MIQIKETENFIQLCDYHFRLSSPRDIRHMILGIDCYFVEGVVGRYETDADNQIVYKQLDELLKVMQELLNQNVNGFYRVLFKKNKQNQLKLI